jgi:hypothetical protein
MPNSNPNNDWKIYSIRKLVEYGALFMAAWQLGIPAANLWHEERTEHYMDEHKNAKPFRAVLSEEWGVKEDRVHIYMKEQNDKLDEIALRFNVIESHVQNEILHPTPGVTLMGGVEFWKDTNNDTYRIHRTENGRGMYFKNGDWEYIYW